MNAKSPIKDIKDVKDLQVFYLVRKSRHQFGSLSHMVRLSALFDNTLTIFVSMENVPEINSQYRGYVEKRMKEYLEQIQKSMKKEGTIVTKTAVGEDCPIMASYTVKESFTELKSGVLYHFGNLIGTPITKVRFILETYSILDEGMAEFMQVINTIPVPVEIERVEVVVSYWISKDCNIDDYGEVVDYIKTNEDDIFDDGRLHIINADTAIKCLKLPPSFTGNIDKESSNMQNKRLIDQIATSFKNDIYYEESLEEAGERLLSSGIYKRIAVDK